MGDFNIHKDDPAFKCFYEGTPPIITDRTKEEIVTKQLKGLEDGVCPAVDYLSPAYPLGDKGHHSTVKWRKGGGQPAKIKPKLETKRTIDFIFHSKAIEKKATLSIPHYDEVIAGSKGLGLPCWKYPSDHFMIGADFVWVQDQ